MVTIIVNLEKEINSNAVDVKLKSMQIITSRQNEFYKNIRKLMNDGRYRSKTGQTIAEGVHLCRSYLDQVGEPVFCVVGQSAIDHGEIQNIIRTIEDEQVIWVSDSLFKELSDLKTHDGILFVVVIDQKNTQQPISEDTLMLDDVQDPGNLGTILRTAAGAGVKDIYLSSGCASAWAPKTLRSGMGAQFVLNIYEGRDLADDIKNATAQVLATSLQTKKSIYRQDLVKPSIWIFGNEGQGVSEELFELVSQRVFIPQSEEIESLNVSAAVAVCLFEQKRQRIENKRKD